jgi:low affinity Fe/Cu permease
MNQAFRRFASRVSAIVGSPWAFIMAVLLLVGWALSGPLFGFSDTWQLVINTTTTIVTFLVVFLIQNTQNRDARAIHLKLDELLRAVQEARTGLVDLENLPDETLERLQQQFQHLREHISAEGDETAKAFADALEEQAVNAKKGRD